LQIHYLIEALLNINCILYCSHTWF